MTPQIVATGKSKAGAESMAGSRASRGTPRARIRSRAWLESKSHRLDGLPGSGSGRTGLRSPFLQSTDPRDTTLPARPGWLPKLRLTSRYLRGLSLSPKCCSCTSVAGIRQKRRGVVASSAPLTTKVPLRLTTQAKQTKSSGQRWTLGRKIGARSRRSVFGETLWGSIVANKPQKPAGKFNGWDRSKDRTGF